MNNEIIANTLNFIYDACGVISVCGLIGTGVMLMITIGCALNSNGTEKDRKEIRSVMGIGVNVFMTTVLLPASLALLLGLCNINIIIKGLYVIIGFTFLYLLPYVLGFIFMMFKYPMSYMIRQFKNMFNLKTHDDINNEYQKWKNNVTEER